MKIKQKTLRSNGFFSILKDRYNKKQHPNQQCGLDEYIDVVDHDTGLINSVKLYKNTKGLHFKKHRSWYLSEFNQEYLYIPYQIIKIPKETP